jgi:hypothetical protein
MRKRDRTGRRTLSVLALVFAVLLIITVIQTAESTKPQPLPFQRVYPEIIDDNIQAVRLRDPNTDATFTISRAADGTWIAPNQTRTLNQNTAVLIARTVALLPYDRTLLLPQASDLSDYGFNPNGMLAVEAVLMSGETHGVLVGTLAPSAAVYYALVDDRPEIYLLHRAAIDFLITQLRTPPVA